MNNSNKINFWSIFLALIFLSGPTIVYSQLAGLENAMGISSLIKSEDEMLIEQSEVQDDDFQSSKKKQEKIDEEEKDREKSLKKPIDLSVRIQPKELNNDLERFGLSLFTDAPTTFAPATDIPIPSDYTIGPGDEIKVILYGKDSDIFEVEVTRDGEIYFPKIGPIVVAGLSFKEMKKTLKEIVEQQLVGAKVSISLGKLRSIKVFILGDAYEPGSYTVSALSTITNALFVSGGINTNGSLRNIQLKRKGKIVQDFDFYDLLLKGDTSGDSRLEPGDVIFIPPSSKLVGASGEFRRPALYELLEGEDFNDLVNIAGGLLPTADRDSGQIERILQGEGLTMLDIDLDIEVNSIDLMDGDIVYAYPVPNRMDKVVLVSSFFTRPGFYQWSQGMKIESIFNSYNDLLPETDLNYLLIKREDPKTKEYSAIQLDLEELFEDIEANSILLNNRDEIFLFSRKIIKEELTEEDILNIRIEELENQVMEAEDLTTANKPKPIKFEDNSVVDLEADQLKQQKKKYNGLDLDDKEKILVVKDDSILAIDPEKLASYQSQGFKEAQQSEEFIEQTSRRENLYQGNRTKLLEPFLAILQTQTKSNELANIVSISGNIFYPGDYPASDNMTVNHLIKAGGGFKQSTYLNEIEITRQVVREKDFDINRINISGKDLSTKLVAGDRLHVKGLTQEVKKVEIIGEVYFPGVYYLKDGETLTELINRAGGFKPNAFLNGALFQRESIKEAEVIRLMQAQKMLRKELIYASTTSNQVGVDTNNQDLTQLLTVLEDDVEPIGRLVLDLQSIVNNESEDLILEDSDKLIIPRKLQSVSVIGEIYVPTSHLFKSGNTVKDYISLSGGAKDMSADLDALYIIKADGSVQLASSQGFFRSGTDFIESGDTIVVPLKTNQFSNIKAASEISQIVYQIAISTAAIQSLK